MFRAFLSNFITHILNLLLTLILPFSISPVYSLLSFTATTDLISSSLCLLAVYCSYPTHPCLFFLTPNHQPQWYQLSFRNTNLIITCKISTFFLSPSNSPTYPNVALYKMALPNFTIMFHLSIFPNEKILTIFQKI